MGKRVRLGIGVTDLFTSALLATTLLAALPSRWMVVDLPLSLLTAALLASFVGSIRDARWFPRVARRVAWLQFALGSLLFLALVATASYLSAVYGPVGKGGMLILLFAALLVLPYLLVLPVAKLWLLDRADSAATTSGPRPPAPSTRESSIPPRKPVRDHGSVLH